MAQDSNKNKGFASMTPEQRKEIARKGGQTTARNREHMAEIGRKGGQASVKKKKGLSGIDVAQ